MSEPTTTGAVLPMASAGSEGPQLSETQVKALQAEIRDLAKARNAVILAHNYELPEIQDVADFVGDSLGLAREGAACDQQTIVFCGVHFMAETASILSPEKRVLIPDLDAGCSLADSITAEQLREWKSKHPGALVVMYVNTTAEVKAETDWCVTSSNAVAVVRRILEENGPDQEILFGPDMFLGAFVEREIGRPLHVWDGECHVHAGIRPDDIERVRAENPGAEFLVHPECGCTTQVMEYIASGDISTEGLHILSTGQMIDYARRNPGGTKIVATETGMLYPMHLADPTAKLVPANRKAFCKYMKMITLEKVRDSLLEDRFEVKVPVSVADRARVPIERMVSVG